MNTSYIDQYFRYAKVQAALAEGIVREIFYDFDAIYSPKIQEFCRRNESNTGGVLYKAQYYWEYVDQETTKKARNQNPTLPKTAPSALQEHLRQEFEEFLDEYQVDEAIQDRKMILVFLNQATQRSSGLVELKSLLPDLIHDHLDATADKIESILAEVHPEVDVGSLQPQRVFLGQEDKDRFIKNSEPIINLIYKRFSLNLLI